MHNTRDYDSGHFPDHIDQLRTPENYTFKNQKLSEAYKSIFDEALEEYNSKQKRADRKIDDYIQHIRNSKNGEKLFYEDVLQWGTRDDFQKHPEYRQIAKECLMEYIHTFEQRNPNLKLVGAYIHMDEASPHLHFDYIPVASGYKTGLSMRNSLSKAMQEMGFTAESKKENETKKWKNREREYFGVICREHGLEVEREISTPERDSLSVAEYKVARDKMIGKIETEKDKMVSLVENLKAASKRLVDPEREKPVILDGTPYYSVPMLQKRSEEIRKTAEQLLDSERTAPVEVAGRMYIPIPELARRSEKAEEELKGIEDMIEHQKGALKRLREEINLFLQKVEELLNKMISRFRAGIDKHEPEVIEEAREQFEQDYLFAPFDERVKSAYKASVMESADKLKDCALNKIQGRDSRGR